MFPVIAHSDDSQIVLTSRHTDQSSKFCADANSSPTLGETPDPFDDLLRPERKGYGRLKPIANGGKLRNR